MMQTCRSILLVLLLALELAGCSSSYQADLVQPLRSFLYATDRARSGEQHPADFYGTDRGPLQYGSCTVAIPKRHRIANFEMPHERSHPERYFTLQSLDTLDQQSFFSELAHLRRSGRQLAVLVFVHGYSICFEEAALRLAQISTDLDFRGVPLLYSWPSGCSVRLYREDERSVAASEGNLYRFLAGIAERSGPGEISLLAHSMGTRAMSAAFALLARERPELLRRFRAVVLAAPDIDGERFRNEVGPALAGKGVPVTLYASRSDKALRISESVNGNPRAGEVKEIPVIVPGIETVDVTDASDGFLGHSYYGQSRTVLGDMFYIINHGLPAAERFSLEPVDTVAGRYWKFRK
ncbi:MAG: alpha/beta hydrolase [Chlorobium sp.]|uniref:alpha/beta hydrolase n=1 Tax=Chlorobium sp. TaxID=1095 RepID=UPI002F3F5004